MADFKIPKDKTAIVLIEPQNDFLSEGGTMYAHIREQLAERHVIANLQELLTPVSYTHLDVYKRQDKILTCHDREMLVRAAVTPVLGLEREGR